MNLAGARVFVAGHRGMVGSALVRRLSREGCEFVVASRAQLDLRREEQVMRFFLRERPDVVVLAAATVGGIAANAARPADFIYDNLAIQTAVIEAARVSGTRKLLFLGSSCIYPKHAPQPISEGALLTGPLEPTNEWYAIAKIAGLKMCQAYRRQYGCDFIAAMPTNLYGSGDRFDLENGHVVPALMLKAHRARQGSTAELEVWGTGEARRELLHVDDLADACVSLLAAYSDEEPVNVGSGSEVTIRELAELVCEVVGFRGRLVFDDRRPDGTPRKLLDLGRLHSLGWHASIPLRRGLEQTYAWFLAHREVGAASGERVG